MERGDEASELASLAGSADTAATGPSSFSGGVQEPVSPPSAGGTVPSDSPAEPQDNACEP